MVGDKQRMRSVVMIPAGRYQIGDESTLNAGPRHYREFDHPVWLDKYPVRLLELEDVVVSGRLQPAANERDACVKHSVDGRYRAILDACSSWCLRKSANDHGLTDFPLCGLTWPEAVQVCQFYAARLPTEAEWEVAMVGIEIASSKETRPVRGKLDDVTRPRSREKCESIAGSLQEWTSDPWSPRYWRSDDRNTTVAVVGNVRISVRGCTSNGVPSLFARMAASQFDVSNPRVFRRVWDRRPELG